MGVEPEQSLLERQATHAPSGSQSLPAWEAQSELVPHWTQVAVFPLQAGVPPEHWAFDVHPVTHTNRLGEQIGLATPQLELLRHSTQVLFAGWQNGAVVGQSELAPHSTHASVSGLHTGSAVEHCDDIVHATHAPVVASHVGSALGQSESTVQGAWH